MAGTAPALQPPPPPPAVSALEIETLRRRFHLVMAVLVVLSLASVAGTVWLWLRWQQLLLMGVTAGFLGSTTAALRSVMQRYADGWENDFGIQAPHPEGTKERFSMRMSYSFLGRPMLGATAGLAMYLGMAAGAWQIQGNPAAVTFYCLLAGLFAKTLFDVLLDKFKLLVGTQEKTSKKTP